VAAHRARAEVFLVPEENYDDAIRKAEQMKIDMKIRAVRSLEEALDYLRSLPSGEQSGAVRRAA
jgi:PDZ domain-containing protein